MTAVGGSHPRGTALQKFSPQLVFKRLHLPGKCGLRQIQAFGGTMQAALLDHGQEGADLEQHDQRVMQNTHHCNRQSALPGQLPVWILSPNHEYDHYAQTTSWTTQLALRREAV